MPHSRVSRLLWFLPVIAGCGEQIASINLQGRVIDFYLQPYAGLVVSIGTRSAVTDAAGAFSLGSVTTPYNIIISDTTAKWAVVFQDLTRPDPTLHLIGIPEQHRGAPTGAIRGQVTGGAGFPSNTTLVGFIPSYGMERMGPVGVDSTGQFSLEQPPYLSPVTGTLYAIQSASGSAPDSRGSTNYTGFGIRTVTYTPAGILGGQDIALGPVRTDSIMGTVILPAGFSPYLKGLFVTTNNTTSALETGEGTALLIDNATQAPFKFRVPVPAGPVPFSVASLAFNGNAAVVSVKTGLVPGAADMTLRLPVGIGVVSPANNATGVTGASDFTWTGPDSSVYIWMFSLPPAVPPGTNTFGNTVEIVTTQRSVHIPTIPWFSTTLHPNYGYAWQVMAVGPLATMDQATGPTGLAVSGNNFAAFTDIQNFATAP